VRPFTQELIDEVGEYITGVIKSLLFKHFGRFPSLLTALKEETDNYLETQKSMTHDELDEMINIELCATYTKNTDYEKTLEKI
jgi:hypothetical protein